MTEREVLELAAKAAGLKVVDNHAPISLYVESEGCKWGIYWNPLADDGDALRLAVKLNLYVGLHHPDSCIHVYSKNAWITEQRGEDSYAATRRAIVRAAAKIGKAMP